MDRPQAKALAAAVRKAIEDAGIEGYTVGKQGGSYDDNGMNIRIRMNAFGDNGMPTSPERTALETMSEWQQEALGIKAEWLDKQFASGANYFKVSGYNSRRPKYPISAKRVSDGKGFKFTVAQVAGNI